MSRSITDRCVLCMAIAWAGVCAVDREAGGAGPQGRELIRDRHFRRGFKLYDPKPGKKVLRGLLQPDASAGKPVWDMAQWNSKQTLVGTRAKRLPSGAISYENAAKAVVVPPAGSPDGDLVLSVNGTVEYGKRARHQGEPWPHLLVSQRFENPPRLADLKKAVLNIAVRLRRSRLHRTEDYTPRLHAAQYQLFLSIQNLNHKSQGYGDFLYFGVPLYDSRRRIPQGYQNPDAAGKFIYTPAGEAYTPKSAHDGNWVTVHKDLMPLLHQALEAAWKRGFLSHSHDLAEYRIAGMNLGWEVPGILDVEMQVKDLSLDTFEKY